MWLIIGLILVIVLIVFGAGKLPQVGEAFGKGIRAFKKGTKGDDEEEATKAETETETETEKKPKRKAKKKKVTKAKTEAQTEAKT
ncbi:MAG: twin-arginine translocase TatA/TatE family subunit [Dehalococcoidales bacterium]|nr:twin-arginine translocase TatA/TatE family subunit [Dehalococcoidales bacterium]